MFYINSAKNVRDGFTVNKHGGTTVSVLKRGGLKAAWAVTCDIAAWPLVVDRPTPASPPA